MSKINYCLLGQVGITYDGRTVHPGSGMTRALLFLLILSEKNLVSVNELVHALWDEPPASARSNLRSYATALRTTLRSLPPPGGQRLITRRGTHGTGGYGLAADADDTDLGQFRRLADRGRELARLGDDAGAVTALQDALSRWRGPVGEDLPQSRHLRLLIDGVNQEFAHAGEDLALVRLRTGDPGPVATELTRRASLVPLRERGWAVLAIARYLSGDPTIALETLTTARRLLCEAVGINLAGHFDELFAAMAKRDDDAVHGLMSRLRRTG